MLQFKGKTTFKCKQKCYIILIYALITCITSCGTPGIIKEHIAADDISGLIDDYNRQKPKIQKKIASHIFSNHNFCEDSYGSLIDFRNRCLDESLWLKFDNIIKVREDSILSVLDSFDNIISIASYYNKHSDEQDFLRPIVAGTLTQGIEEYEYKDVRAMFRAFKDTDIKDTIFPYYIAKREEALPQAISAVDAYCKSEMKIFNVYRNEGKKRIPQVSAKAFEKMIDQLLDFNIPNNQSQLMSLYNNITGKNNPIGAIKDIVKDETGKMMKDMNECRGELVKELLDYPNSKRYKLPTIPISVKKIPVKCPINDFKTISIIQNKPDKQSKATVLLSLASWLPGIVGTAATVADIYKTFKDEEKKAAEVSPHIKIMAKSVFANFIQTCKEEYDASFNNIKKTILKSHEQLKQAIHEDF